MYFLNQFVGFSQFDSLWHMFEKKSLYNTCKQMQTVHQKMLKKVSLFINRIRKVIISDIKFCYRRRILMKLI